MNRFPKLFCITHKLGKVKENGLPKSGYNKSLNKFDEELVNLFPIGEEGIVILVETFGGTRNYWYYLSSDTNYDLKVSLVRKKYPLNSIETSVQDDDNWGFIEEYPIQLYDKR